ncbi:MAG: SGNH/GDSL hydrolase family protein [Candidatus Eisenbacteria bacterium]
MVRFQRYVAIGDSSTEGIDDPDGRGAYRGWSRRLAARIARQQGGVLYANFGVRGRTTREIREQQLAPALALRPDLATVFAGTNDVVGWRFGAAAVARDMEHMQRALMAGGATVVTFTLPDLTPVMPIARWIAPRIVALNNALRQAAASSGAILVDFAAYELGSDFRFWSGDRIHANAAGHARIAEALADALGLPGSDDSWKQPMPALPQRTAWEVFAAESSWALRHLLPWVARAFAPRSSGEALDPGRISLTPVAIEP